MKTTLIKQIQKSLELEYHGKKQKVYEGDVVDLKWLFDTITIRIVKNKPKEPNLLPAK